MKKSIVTLGLMSLFVLITAMQCEDDDVSASCKNTEENLSELSANIDDLARASVCGDNFECRYIGIGSKPCGGPTGYLIYSTSIDTEALIDAVAEYNQLAADYILNCKPDIASDCSVLSPPVSFTCENNKCIPVY